MPDGRRVIFDREYDPIAALEDDKFGWVIPPGEFVPYVGISHFYEDATSPGINPRTLPKILGIARTYSLEDEIRLRWKVSDGGWLIGEDYPERLAAARGGALL